MVLNIVIARKGEGSTPIECEPITKVIECRDGISEAELGGIHETAIFDLGHEHGIDFPLWGSSTKNSMDDLVEGFVQYFNEYEKRRCANLVNATP